MTSVVVVNCLNYATNLLDIEATSLLTELVVLLNNESERYAEAFVLGGAKTVICLNGTEIKILEQFVDNVCQVLVSKGIFTPSVTYKALSSAI